MSEDENDRPHPLRQRRDMRNFDSLIDKLIGQARAEGQFDNLPGEGKPQALGDDDLVPDEDKLAYRMLKSNNFAPPWMEARRDIEQERARIAGWLSDTNRRWERMPEAARSAARADYRRMLDDLRRMIINYNLTSPPAAGQIEGLNLTAELGKLGGRGST